LFLLVSGDPGDTFYCALPTIALVAMFGLQTIRQKATYFSQWMNGFPSYWRPKNAWFRKPFQFKLRTSVREWKGFTHFFDI